MLGLEDFHEDILGKAMEVLGLVKMKYWRLGGEVEIETFEW